MKRTFVILLVLGLAGFVLFRSLFGGQTVTWHQRLTVTVETPSGDVSGSSVTEVAKIATVAPVVPMEARGVHSRVIGEAVGVEVLPGRYLFALLDAESGEGSWQRDAAHWVYPAFGLRQEGSYAASMRKLKSQPRDTPVPLPPEGWPLMVTFDDISNPTTVRKVDPADLSASFGAGVRLKSLTLEVTKAPITEGRMEEVLGWLGPYPEPALGPATGKSGDVPFYRLVHMGDFIRRPE